MHDLNQVKHHISYVKAGVIDDIDIALMIHPGNETYPTINTLAVDVLALPPSKITPCTR
jgi:hypothetical protein